MILQIPSLTKRPYKNFADFIYQHRLNYNWHYNYFTKKKIHESNILWPCFYCEGVGRIIDPNYERDPIEGYKLADRVNCPYCMKGETSKEKYQEAYKQDIGRWKQLRKKEKQTKDLVTTAIKKLVNNLTKEEIQSLGITFTINDERKIKKWKKK